MDNTRNIQRRIEVQLVWVPYLLLGAMFVYRREGWVRLQREMQAPDIVEMKNQVQVNLIVDTWSVWRYSLPSAIFPGASNVKD